MADEKIKVRMSPTADTRTADHIVSKEELERSSKMHIRDVAAAMRWFADRLEEAGENHDWTKLAYLDEFHEQFHKAQVSGVWGTGWYDRIHVAVERHHLDDRCPDDVSLIDVFEQIADSVMAGIARSGSYRFDGIDPRILYKAYRNTAMMLANAVELSE